MTYVQIERSQGKRVRRGPLLKASAIHVGAGLVLGGLFADCDTSNPDDECLPGAGHQNAQEIGISFLWGVGAVAIVDLAVAAIIKLGDKDDDD